MKVREFLRLSSDWLTRASRRRVEILAKIAIYFPTEVVKVRVKNLGSRYEFNDRCFWSVGILSRLGDCGE